MNDAELGAMVRSLFAALAQPAPQTAEAPRYANIREHGAGTYRAALRAINAGELRAFEVARGKRLVLLEDWHRWLERDEHRVQPSHDDGGHDDVEADDDELAEVIRLNRARQRKRSGGAT